MVILTLLEKKLRKKVKYVPSAAGLKLRKLLCMRKFSCRTPRIVRLEQEKLGQLKENLDKTQEELRQVCFFGVKLLKQLAIMERAQSKKAMFRRMLTLENKKLKKEKMKLEGEVYELRQRIVELEISERENEMLRRDYDRVLEINRSLRTKNETLQKQMTNLKIKADHQRQNLERKSSQLHIAKFRLKREEGKLIRRTSGVELAKRRLHEEEKKVEKKRNQIELHVKEKLIREEAMLGRTLSQITLLKVQERNKKKNRIRGSESFYYLCGKVNQTLKEMRNSLAKLRSEFCANSNVVNDKMETFLSKLPEVVHANQVCPRRLRVRPNPKEDCGPPGSIYGVLARIETNWFYLTVVRLCTQGRAGKGIKTVNDFSASGS